MLGRGVVRVLLLLLHLGFHGVLHVVVVVVMRRGEVGVALRRGVVGLLLLMVTWMVVVVRGGRPVALRAEVVVAGVAMVR